MTSAAYNVKLTADELLLLDGRCSAEVQTSVDLVKEAKAVESGFGEVGNAEELARFVAEAVAEARAKGVLVYQHKSLTHCKICKKSAGYVIRTRGRDRGRPNYDKPLSFRGLELARNLVTMQGHVDIGGCVECVAAALPVLKQALAAVEAELPEQLREPGSAVWKRFDKVACSNCGWDGHEGLMGRRPTLFFDGTYPAICPQCKAENVPLGRHVVAKTKGHAVVRQSG